MAAAVLAAKKKLRKELKCALAAMSKQQMQEESAILTTKVEELRHFHCLVCPPGVVVCAAGPRE